MNRTLLLGALLVASSCSNNRTQPPPAVQQETIRCQQNTRVACKVSLITLTTQSVAWNGRSVEVSGFVSETGDALYFDRDSMEYGITQNAVGLIGFQKRKPGESAFAQLSGTFFVNKNFDALSLDSGPDGRFPGTVQVSRRFNMISYDPYHCVNGKGAPPDGTVRKLVGDNKCISAPMPPDSR